MPSDNEHFTDDGASDVEPAETEGTRRTPPKKSAERAEHDAPADAATSHQFTWSQSAEEITLEMPFAGNARSLAVHTDGRTLKVSWDQDSLVVDLWAPILESATGPARLRHGVFTLQMRKMRAESWPSFTREPPAQSPNQEPSSEELGASSGGAGGRGGDGGGADQFDGSAGGFVDVRGDVTKSPKKRAGGPRGSAGGGAGAGPGSGGLYDEGGEGGEEGDGTFFEAIFGGCYGVGSLSSCVSPEDAVP